MSDICTLGAFKNTKEYFIEKWYQHLYLVISHAIVRNLKEPIFNYLIELIVLMSKLFTQFFFLHDFDTGMFVHYLKPHLQPILNRKASRVKLCWNLDISKQFPILSILVISASLNQMQALVIVGKRNKRISKQFIEILIECHPVKRYKRAVQMKLTGCQSHGAAPIKLRVCTNQITVLVTK